MPESNHPSAILQAFIATALCSLATAEKSTQPMQTRHMVTVLSRLAWLMIQLAEQHPELAPARPDLEKLIAEGKRISAATPYLCQECNEPYLHQPPATSRTLCEFCLAETQANI